MAAAAGGAAVLPAICASPAFASSGELAIVNRPDHPAAEYPTGLTATTAQGIEPLNATVDCALPGKGA